MKIVSMQLQPYALPFERTLQTARGPHSFRYGWLLVVTEASGRRGFGDAAPWPGFASRFEEVAEDISRLASPQAVAQLPEIFELAEIASLGALTQTPEVRFAFELALLDLLGQQRQQSIAELIHTTPHDAVASQQLWTGTADAKATGTVKVKVGSGSLADDLARVRLLREDLAPSTRLRLDAGGGWSPAVAMKAIQALAPLQVELIEQPIATGQPKAWLPLHAAARQAGIALAADESVCSPDYPQLLSQRSLDAVVLKPMFLGGILAAQRLGDEAQEAGLLVVVTHALESAVGRCGALHLASGYGGVHGLGTALAEDFCRLQPIAGELPRPTEPGLGLALAKTPRPHPITPATVAASQKEGAKLPLPLESSAIAYPERLALTFQGQQLRYCELRDRVCRTAALLHDRGIQPGERVGLEGPVNLGWVVLFHALGWLGAIVAPFDAAGTKEERSRWKKIVGVNRVIHSAHELAQANHSHKAMGERFWRLDDIRLLLCTSGTTAEAKPVAIDGLQLLSGAFGSAMRLGHLPTDAWLCCLPLHHIGGLAILIRAAFAGTCVHLEQRFDAPRCNHRIDQGEVQLISLVPTMLQQLLDDRAGRPFPASLRAIVLGGAAASQSLLDQAQRCQAPLAVSYGMSETAAQVATSEPHRHDQGWLPPLLGSRLTVQPQASSSQSDQVPQRLLVQGLQTRTGEIATHDLGEVVQGRVRVAGRADRTIISGAKNIDPDEVATAICEHPAVAKAVVVGLANRRWGERPHALVVAHTERPSNQELRDFLASKLSRYKLPDSFLWRDDLPQTSLGKIRFGLARRILEEAQRTPLPEPQRGGERSFEGLQIDKGVDQLNPGSETPIAAAEDAVSKGDRALSQGLDARHNIEPVVQPHGRHKVGFAVDQRHADPFALDHRFDAVATGQERLLVSGVTKLKNPSEKQYAGSVHVEEPNGGAMYERHDDER